MTSNSESPDRALSSIDSNCIARPKDKTSLRLRLGRIFSSNGLKSPKSPKSVSSSRGSSPSHGSPRARMRYSWQPGTFDSEENQSPHTSESGISNLSSSSKSSSIGINAISSPKSPSTPKSPCSLMWYLGDSAGAAECAANEDDERPHHSPSTVYHPNDRVDVQVARRRGGASPLLFSPVLSSPVLSCPRFRCTSSSSSAERYAPRTESLWKVARSPARIIDVRARRTSCSDQTRVDQRT